MVLIFINSDHIGVLLMNKYGKRKKKPPTMSRYYFFKILFLTNHQPNFTNHDFPVLGFLLTSFACMVLDQNNSVPNNEEFGNDETVFNKENKSPSLFSFVLKSNTAQGMKFSIKDFCNKCEIHSFLRIWSHLLKKSLMESIIFFAVKEHSPNSFRV